MVNQSGDQQLRTIGQVVKDLQAQFPDVSHSSLRFLEREGFITAVRTEGGHRLYTSDDVARIIQIKTWQGQRLSLEQIRARIANLGRLPGPDALARAFVETALAGDFAVAGRVITDADEVGLPLETLFGGVMTPALHEIGRMWEQGALPVAQEKEVSELSREVIVELTRRHAVSGSAGPIVVAGCVEGERHELGLRMICGLLRSMGYRVHFLGADVALEFLLDAIVLRSPRIVLLSAKLASTLPALKSTLESLNSAASNQPARFDVLVGGDLAAHETTLIERLGATAVVDRDLGRAIAAIQAMLARRMVLESARNQPG